MIIIENREKRSRGFSLLESVTAALVIALPATIRFPGIEISRIESRVTVGACFAFSIPRGDRGSR